MTSKERTQFEKSLEKVAFDATKQACDIAASISVPLEIEALKVIRERIDDGIFARENRMQIINQSLNNSK